MHYSEGPTDQSVKSIQNFHMDSRGWSDIGYNFLVDNKGRIYEGRGWLVIGAHATGHNTSGIGVCFIGRDGDATDAAKKAIRWLYDEGRSKAGHPLSKNGHGQLSGNSTNCPGKQLLSWVKAGMPAPGGGDPTPPGPPKWPGRYITQPPIMRGDDVRTWQAQMKKIGKSIDVDGAYGPKSEAVCRAFQKERKLSVDGIIGPDTWAAAWKKP
ncbi:peptidoglycan recognition protein family protein [Spirillospora sp. CA-294931]|uniref:peptidoglycan recognition protein family protein n=1 Tax=Spirillospora sp. CA-294931 TaxID=3240042 RepID=UPI003D93A142